MIDHHIQRKIVRKLAFTNALRFSELQPDGLDNKLFDYHLKKVQKAGLVNRTKEGLYKLSSEGKRVAVHASQAENGFVDEPQSVLLLSVQRKSDEAWLLYTRKTQPVLGLTGFMHTRPNAMQGVESTASEALLNQTNLSGKFSVRGCGFFKMYSGAELESFTNFTLLHCKDAVGELAGKDEYAEYAWFSEPDFKSSTMLPNMQILVEKLNSTPYFFIDQRIDI